MAERFPPVHPGEILRDEFLTPMGITEYRLAHAIGVDPRRINLIIQGQRAVTADTALRLDRYFGVSDGFWIGLQSHYDLETQRDRIGDDLDRITPFRAAS